jgi:hypothetical protein
MIRAKELSPGLNSYPLLPYFCHNSMRNRVIDVSSWLDGQSCLSVFCKGVSQMIRRQSNLSSAVVSHAQRVQAWSSRSSVAAIDKPGGGKRSREEQLASVVANTRRNQKRLERALEAGNTMRATTLAALVAKGMEDARRLARELEEAGRTTFAKAKDEPRTRPLINWSREAMQEVAKAAGVATQEHLPRAHSSAGK